MKKFISIIMLISVLVGCLFLTGCKKDDENANNEKAVVWPNCTNYKIPEMNDVVLESVESNNADNKYLINYTVKVSNVNEEKIENYRKSFGKEWTLMKNENIYTSICSMDGIKVSVVIAFNKENSTARIVMSAIE